MGIHQERNLLLVPVGIRCLLHYPAAYSFTAKFTLHIRVAVSAVVFCKEVACTEQNDAHVAVAVVLAKPFSLFIARKCSNVGHSTQGIYLQPKPVFAQIVC